MRSISREVDLAWLAGIIDGEGNLNAVYGLRKSGDIKRVYFVPAVRITNTDVRMIKHVSEIYAANGINFFYRINAVSRYKNKKPTWHDQLEITVGNPGNVAKVLQLVLPYLVSKQRYAEILFELITWMKSQPHRGRNSRTTRYPDKPEFIRYIEMLKAEKSNLIDPSTTKRRAREVLSW